MKRVWGVVKPILLWLFLSLVYIGLCIVVGLGSIAFTFIMNFVWTHEINRMFPIIALGWLAFFGFGAASIFVPDEPLKGVWRRRFVLTVAFFAVIGMILSAVSAYNAVFLFDNPLPDADSYSGYGAYFTFLVDMAVLSFFWSLAIACSRILLKRDSGKRKNDAR